MIPQPKKKSTTRKIWDMKKIKAVLGPKNCAYILFVHAILGCDTKSGIHGIGKGSALNKLMKDAQFQEQAEVFNKSLVCLYNGRSKEGLDSF